MPKPCSIDFHLLFGLLTECTILEGAVSGWSPISYAWLLQAALPRQQMDRGRSRSSAETQMDVLHECYGRGTDFVARHEKTNIVQQSVEYLIQN